MKNLYLIGGGGHCKSCIDVIESSREFIIRGVFDVKEKVGTDTCGYKIIGTDTDIKNHVESDNYFLITVGQIKDPAARTKIFEMNLNFATVISTRAHVSKHAKIGIGTIVMHDALVNAGARIGKNCILNTKSLVEHDAIVEDFCHISTGAILNGGCLVKKSSFIGSNAVLREKSVIEENSVIAFGTKI